MKVTENRKQRTVAVGSLKYKVRDGFDVGEAAFIADMVVNELGPDGYVGDGVYYFCDDCISTCDIEAPLNKKFKIYADKVN